MYISSVFRVDLPDSTVPEAVAKEASLTTRMTRAGTFSLGDRLRLGPKHGMPTWGGHPQGCSDIYPLVIQHSYGK